MKYPISKYDVTTITVTSYDRKVSIEIPMDSNADEVFDAFKTIMVGMTFTEQMFDDAVTNYYFEHQLGKDNHDTDSFESWTTPANLDTTIKIPSQDC